MDHISNILSQKSQDLHSESVEQPETSSYNSPLHGSEFSLSFSDEFSAASTPTIPHAVPQHPPLPVSTLDVQKMKSIIYSMKDQLNALVRILDGELVATLKTHEHPKTAIMETGEKIIEGVFNGEFMIGEDGKEYTVPPNYASKSKMVEGDLLKLTITNKGSFIYKQIGPTNRKRIIGELVKHMLGDKEQWIVVSDNKTYKVLTASVSFYKANSGDEVILLIPQNGMSEWGAIDNVIKK